MKQPFEDGGGFKQKNKKILKKNLKYTSLETHGIILIKLIIHQSSLSAGR